MKIRSMMHDARNRKHDARCMKHDYPASCFMFHVSCFLLLASCFMLLISSADAVQKQTTIAPVKKQKIYRKKRLKYVAPPQKELKVEEMPLALPISPEAIDAYAKGDIEEAVRVLRTEEPSSKSLHLIRGSQRILSFQKDKKVPKLDRHKFLQNIGIAYHDLFLFLKANGNANDIFYRQALKFYTKAGHSLAISEKTESALLKAAIMAASGKWEKAEKIFSKLELDAITDTHRGLEYIACYYAALVKTDAAIEMLMLAYEKNPEKTLLWLAIGDDFFRIKDEPLFKEFILRHPR